MPVTVHATPCLLTSFLSLAFQTHFPHALPTVQGSWQTNVFLLFGYLQHVHYWSAHQIQTLGTISPLNF